MYQASTSSVSSSLKGSDGWVQGITNISVQSSVSLQHLPVDKRIEKGLAPQLLERLSFATQKLDEIVAAARAVAGLTPDQLDRLPAPKAPSAPPHRLNCQS